jgi:predicted glycoside hydrolase/deacetylase ChbG (UPF0249 family)
VATLLLVNADDFNLTAGVSRGIVEAHRRGIVTGTTALVNLPGLAASREAAAAVPGLDVGLHFNLTLGPPVLPPERVVSLLDAAGRFRRDPDRFVACGDPGEIRAELTAQLERFLTLFGRAPTHLDSHHHIHRHPRVLEAVLQVAEASRLPVRPTPPEVGALLRRRGIPTVDRTLGDITEAALRDPGRLAELLSTLPDGVAELICHPGYQDADLAVSRYAAEREQELHALCEPAVRRAVTAAGIRLIGFRSLATMRGEIA